ncbi:MAG: putative transcription regulator [Deltaproteobacteria bacterium]|nr:putative transcription regulator [Deltaproteobacteria bacterium]
MTGKQRQAFFDVHSGLPREGPGSDRSTRRAFSRVGGLPPAPRILDVGCGPGAQTVCLAGLTRGPIFAVDTHVPFLRDLERKCERGGWRDRVFPVAADMNRLPFSPGSFDLVWAEGSIYIAGAGNALAAWRPLLKTDGVIAYTEVSWLKKEIPEEPHRFWKEAYPAIGSIRENEEIARFSGYEPLEIFVLPESDWWDEYYDPIRKKLPALRDKYRSDDEALAVLDTEEAEMDLYRKYSAFYGYVFYLAKRWG